MCATLPFALRCRVRLARGRSTSFLTTRRRGVEVRNSASSAGCKVARKVRLVPSQYFPLRHPSVHIHALRHTRRGQTLVEFAIVLPILLLVIGGLVQLGILFWAQNTITQVARDTGRWAATQQARPCESGVSAVEAKANEIAAVSSLIGYDAASFNVTAAWTGPSGELAADCPPPDNTHVWWVDITVESVVPVVFPGMQFINPPCTVSGCTLSSSTQFRMEPAP
jgi:hypothetical protein